VIDFLAAPLGQSALDRKKEDKKALAVPERDWASEEMLKIVGTNSRNY